MTRDLPLVYACAGCSLAGRVSYDVAQELTRRNMAQMSCLAGIAADLAVFTQQLDEHRVWVIDGCPLECAKGVFDRLGRSVDRHIRLREYGVPKNETHSTCVDVATIVDCIGNERPERACIDR